MNKIPPVKGRPGGKGSKDDDKTSSLGQDKEDTKTAELMTRIRKRMDRCIQAESDNRRDALDDLKFKAGNQWPADVAAQRNFDKRPCLTINKFPTLIHMITNAQRENRPGINVSPIGDRSDPEVAQMYKGMIREIERESNADEAYDTGFDNAVSNGFGYWRVVTEYEAPDSFDQVVRIKRIRNPFTVYMDPESQDSVGSDAKYAFVTEMIPRDEYKELYPDADPLNFEQAGTGETLKNWIASDAIRIAEYFEITSKKRTLVNLSNGWTGWEDELADQTKDDIREKRLEVRAKRESMRPKITWYKVNALQILSEREWMGDWIPIVRVPGDEIDIEGKVKWFGVIRHAKDSQRMFNYWRTSATEIVALAPKAPWVMEEGQLEGHEDEWKQSNTKSYPVLTYKAVSVSGAPAPPPQRQQPGQVPAGIVNAATEAAQDMMATTGVRFDASPNERMIDESGRAINELRRSGDIGAFHFIDNLSRALMQTGIILLDLIPKIYDTPRVITILREDDSEEQVKIDPNAPKAMQQERLPNQKVRKIFNPTYGKYGITVTIGPSYATKRIEAAHSMMEFAKAMPQAAALIMDLIVKNMDWEGADEIAKRLAKALPPNLLIPDMKDVPPQVQAMLQGMEQQVKTLTAELQKAMMALNDKTADRNVEMTKIQNDFEAKLLNVVMQMETKTAATHEKSVSNFNSHIGAQIKELGTSVTQLVHKLEQANETQAVG